MESVFYLAIKKKEVSFEQFCALVSQDIWAAYISFQGRGNPTSKEEWDVNVMGNFEHYFGQNITHYEIIGHPIVLDNSYDSHQVAKLRDKARELIYDFLSPRWVC